MADAATAEANDRRSVDRSSIPFVSVIVPVFNDQRSLAILLWALADQDYPRERFECLVIDNGSDKPIRIPSDCPIDVRVLREEQPGSYAARNRGLREAIGDILAFTDADCIPRGDWLTSGVKQIEAVGGPAMLAGQVEVACPDERKGNAFQWHSVANDLNQQRFLSRFHFAATANLVTTRDVFERTGTFNALLFSGGDLEWGRRAWSLGIKQIYAADVVVRHPPRASWQALVAKTRRIAGGHYTLNSRTNRPLTATLALTLSIAAASLWRSWSDPRLPTAICRLRVMAIDFALRLIQLGEVVRLRFGGQPRRS